MKRRLSIKQRKILIIIFIVLILLVGGFICYRYLKNKSGKLPEINKVEVLDTIKNYNYVLEDRDTEIYKENFLELKKVLESEVIDYNSYAHLLAKLFVIDLYTINNKINKYDVGALDFIYEQEKEKFSNKAMDSIYKLIEDNSDKKRKQLLPEVNKVEITHEEESIYEKSGINMNAYKIDLKIDYVKDLGYDENVSLYLVQENTKIYVVKIEAL